MLDEVVRAHACPGQAGPFDAPGGEAASTEGSVMLGAGVAGAVLGMLVVLFVGDTLDYAREPVLWLFFACAVLIGQASGRSKAAPPLAAAMVGFALGGLLLTGIHNLGSRSVVPGVVEQLSLARRWKSPGWRYVVKTERGTFGIFFRTKPKYLVGDRVSVHLQTLIYTHAENLSDPVAPP